MKRLLATKQNGISLLEVMLSLVIIAAILLMATKFYSSTRRSEMVNAAAAKVQTILQGAQHYYETQQTVSSLDLPTLQNLGLIPSDFKIDPSSSGKTSIYNSWGGDISLEPITAPSGVCPPNTPCAIEIEFTQLPSKACADLSAVIAKVETPMATPTCTPPANPIQTLTVTYALSNIASSTGGGS